MTLEIRQNIRSVSWVSLKLLCAINIMILIRNCSVTEVNILFSENKDPEITPCHLWDMRYARTRRFQDSFLEWASFTQDATFLLWIACHVGNALLFFYCILYQMFIAEAHTFSENMLVFGISRILAVNWFDMHCPSQYQNLNTVCLAAEVDKKFILSFQPARIHLLLEEVQESCRTNSFGTRLVFSESHSHHACVDKGTFQPRRVSPVLFAERIIPFPITCKAPWHPQ